MNPLSKSVFSKNLFLLFQQLHTLRSLFLKKYHAIKVLKMFSEDIIFLQNFAGYLLVYLTS
ncbi:hypothetical protein K737_300371 [Holospora undulata HU1]|uniref:Uncharacterized protein n=1 Tax=Holospora undulata HU1 TaxID=1321371 RepID=A0A061JI23_9PROT|nr:hypothetical protein K737_300371 [Holospora undulata HU1]